MPIKRITYAIIVVCFAFMIVVGILIYRGTIQRSLDDLLISRAESKAASVEICVHSLKESLKRLAVNIATYDQAAFLRSDSGIDADANATATWQRKSFYIDNSLNCLILSSRDSGNILFSRYYDRRLDMFVDLPSSLAEALASRSIYPRDGNNCQSSVVMYSDHPLLLASRIVARSPQDSAEDVVLVIGQILDQEQIRSMRAATGTHIVGITPASPNFPQSMTRQTAALSENASAVVRYETAAGFLVGTVLTDINADLAFLLLVEPEEGELEGVAALSRRYQSIIIVLALVAMVVLVLFFAHAVFSPLARFSRILNKINRHEYDLTGKPAALGRFTELSDGLIELIRQIDIHDREKYKSDSRLLYRVKVEETLSIISRILLRDSVAGIAQCLRTISRNFNTDFCCFWQVSSDRESMHCLGSFRDLITGEHTGEFDFTAPTAKWINNAVRHNGSILIHDINDIPEDLEEVKKFLQEFEVKSFFGVPMNSSSGRIGGFIAIGAIRNTRTWTEEDKKGLESVAELFAFMLDKHTRVQ